jgi:uncharacterized protein with HEPN domain
VADILQALQRVEEIGRRGRDAILGDWLLQDAAIRNFEIVGEAVKRVSADLQAAHPEIPWADLAGLRDVLIHQYFRVDLEIVWALIENAWHRCAATWPASSRRSVRRADAVMGSGACRSPPPSSAPSSRLPGDQRHHG